MNGAAPDPRDLPDLEAAYAANPWDETDTPDPSDYADLGPARQKRTLPRAWASRTGSGWRP